MEYKNWPELIADGYAPDLKKSSNLVNWALHCDTFESVTMAPNLRDDSANIRS